MLLDLECYTDKYSKAIFQSSAFVDVPVSYTIGTKDPQTFSHSHIHTCLFPVTHKLYALLTIES